MSISVIVSLIFSICLQSFTIWYIFKHFIGMPRHTWFFIILPSFFMISLRLTAIYLHFNNYGPFVEDFVISLFIIGISSSLLYSYTKINKLFKSLSGYENNFDDMVEKRFKKEWEETFDSIPDLITVLDTNFTILRANEAVLKFLDLTEDEIVGKHCYELIHGTVKPPAFCPFHMLLCTGTSVPVEVKLGNTIFLVSVHPFYDKNTLKGVIHIARDVTSLKKTEIELEKKKEELYALNLAKTQDLLDSARMLNAGVAHELRTPMQAIINVIELLQSELVHCYVEEAKSTMKALLEDAEIQLTYSIGVLNSLSAYAKSGVMVGVHCIDVFEELVGIIKTLRFVDPFKALDDDQFHIQEPSFFSCAIKINKSDFRQIIENLCKNSIEAIKGVEPKISIKVTKEIDLINIHIIDNGVGVPDKYKDDIFKPYFSTKIGKTQQNQGLGLAIVKNLVIKNGGNITFNSHPGYTEFIVTFPCAKAEIEE